MAILTTATYLVIPFRTEQRVIYLFICHRTLEVDLKYFLQSVIRTKRHDVNRETLLQIIAFQETHLNQSLLFNNRGCLIKTTINYCEISASK